MIIDLECEKLWISYNEKVVASGACTTKSFDKYKKSRKTIKLLWSLKKELKGDKLKIFKMQAAILLDVDRVFNQKATEKMLSLLVDLATIFLPSLKAKAYKLAIEIIMEKSKNEYIRDNAA